MGIGIGTGKGIGTGIGIGIGTGRPPIMVILGVLGEAEGKHQKPPESIRTSATRTTGTKQETKDDTTKLKTAL